MKGVIKYLKSPELVLKVQNYFGVEYLLPEEYNKRSTKKRILNNSSTLSSSSSDYTKCTPQRNGTSCSRPSVNHHHNHITTTERTEKPNSTPSPYIVRNKFWFYLFLIGTELGDEIFYATFIPFWFWNVDSAVGRRVIFLWSIVMYIGQSFKDIIRWPRPGPPVARLQNKWAQEYGMPSTHAMVGLSIPFSVVIFTIQRYQYPAMIGLFIAIIWCSVICVSRVYLGMHSVLDIIAGLLLTFILMIFLVPLVDYLDFFILSSTYSPIVVLIISIMLIVFYPKSDKWTPTRGDTTMTVSVCAGIQIGAWINYQLGDMVPTSISPPYVIIWPNYQMLGLLILRTILGLCCIVATRAIGKSLSYAFVSALLGKDKNELLNSESTLENRNKTIVELSYKYFTCGMIGLNTQYLLPNVFKLLGIGRPDFYTEI